MVYIPGENQDINPLQYLTLSDSLSAEYFSMEFILYEDTKGAHKYEFSNRENDMHNISSEEKSGYISLPVSTYSTIG